MDNLLQCLRAAGESTRLRLIALLARNDLTVSELTQILGQSQPRVSRHLKLLTDAGLVARYQEGTWAFYRLADSGQAATIVEALVSWMPEADPILEADIRRLESVRQSRSGAAAAYFRRSAEDWDRIRSLHVDDAQVEQAMLEIAGNHPVGDLLDLGTGTGRVLEIFSGRIRRGVGIDLSRDMLSVARAKLDETNTRNCHVRHGDVYNLSLPAGSIDLVTIHQVLHFLDDPATAVQEAVRTLRPRGRLIVVDFAPHELEFLRTEYAHRRLGFADQEVTQWCHTAGLEDVQVQHLTPACKDEKKRLTVSIWTGVQRKDAPAHYRLDVA